MGSLAAAKPAPCRRVLIIEDDQALRDSLTDILVEAGFIAVAVENGRAGLDWLGRNPEPHVILLDLKMPVMTGSEFMREVAADAGLSRIPIVVLSASTRREQAALGYPRAAATDHIQKPFRLDRLIGALEQRAGVVPAG